MPDALSGAQINRIISLCELAQLAGRRTPHKDIAIALGCTVWQSRYYWRRYLRHKKARQSADVDLKREIAEAVADRPVTAPYKNGDLGW